MKIARIIPLASLGENHKDDYIKFSDISYKEAQQLQGMETESDADQFITLLKNKLMGGQITDDETSQIITITKDNLEEVPISVLTMAVNQLVGGVDETLK